MQAALNYVIFLLFVCSLGTSEKPCAQEHQNQDVPSFPVNSHTHRYQGASSDAGTAARKKFPPTRPQTGILAFSWPNRPTQTSRERKKYTERTHANLPSR